MAKASDKQNSIQTDSGKETKPSRTPFGDRAFKFSLNFITGLVLVILTGVFVTLIVVAFPSIKEFGLGFFTSSAWNQRKTEVKDIEVLNEENEISLLIDFTADLSDNAAKESYYRFVDESKNEYDLTITAVCEMEDDETVVCGIKIKPDFEPKMEKAYTLSIDQSLNDIYGKPLLDGFNANFSVIETEDGLLTLNWDSLTYATSGESVEYTLDSDMAEKWFGALPFVVGTLLTSIIALLISLPFSIAVSLFLGEYYTSGPISNTLKTANELLAGIPSVIYGFWAFGFLVPVTGANIMTASVILAIMIIPYSASLARESISLVPQHLKEAAYATGATRFSVALQVILPYAASGIFAGFLLAFGRALGETMAVTLVIGNANIIPSGLFSEGQTIASLIANQYNEAEGIHLSSLTQLGLLLFLFTMLFGVLGRKIIRRFSIKGGQ